jgi:peptide/nickel transport system substrate-binding protein
MGRGRVRATLAAAAATALLLTGCAAGGSLGDAGIVVGTALPVTSLDPAADAGAGGPLVAEQIYPHLLTIRPGTSRLVPAIAAPAGFRADGAYAVRLKPDLRFANGDRLEASDVVRSFTRQRAIKAPGGPWPLLAGVTSVRATGDRTVVFRLATPGDQRFPDILASQAGAIVDEEVFPAHALAAAQDIVATQPFAGPYTVQSFNPGDLITFHVAPHYRGALGSPHAPDVTLKLYGSPSTLVADVTDRAIDLGYGGIGPSQLQQLDDHGADVVAAAGGAARYLVFDLDGMPYGAKQRDAAPQRAQAVRHAVADHVDRRALALTIDHGATAPLYGFIPDGLPGADPVLRASTGDDHGQPDITAAEAELDQADVATPLTLTLTLVPELDPPGTLAEYRALAAQLELGGLFQVDIDEVDAADFAAKRPKAALHAYPGSWSPDGTDPATYRMPYQLGDAQLGSHYATPSALELLAAPITRADPAKRSADVRRVQRRLADDMPVVPLVQYEQLAVTADGLTGVRFDGSFTLRFGSLRMP